MDSKAKKVLLISMPFGGLDRPALGLSLLKARLNQEAIECDIRYLNLTFAELTGYDEYHWLVHELPYTAFIGDWIFTGTLYGEQQTESDRQAYIDEVLRGNWQLSDNIIQMILRLRAMTQHFIDYCMALVPWDNYALVGFTSTFEQNIASLALAKSIKAAHPAISIVFGGANWEAEMGRELHARFPFVDYACSGEADQTFPALVKKVLGNSRVDENSEIGGLVFRASDGRTVFSGAAPLVREVDNLPVPDFSDYFRDLNQSTIAASILPILLVETSRGCWWGAVSHCTFCGLNGGTMTFRSKSPRRVLDELDYLVNRWQIEFVEVVDNILDLKYFDSVLPALAQARRPIQLVYETKANLTRHQVRLLSQAGVGEIQPGIESLSNHILKLMRKGTTALRNIQLLKWCKEFNIVVDWNILYGFPGETREDYREMLELLRAIRFLAPPRVCAPIRLDRFSPFFNDPAAFGFTNLRATAPYKYLYPFEAESLNRIAYYYDYDYPPYMNPAGYADEVRAFVEDWRLNPETGMLISTRLPEGKLVLKDSRQNAPYPELVLSAPEQVVYEFCDALHTAPVIFEHVRQRFGSVTINEQAILDFLDFLVKCRLMVTDGQYYLSLAIKAQPPSIQPDARSVSNVSVHKVQ